jgi:hypothetical protein
MPGMPKIVSMMNDPVTRKASVGPEDRDDRDERVADHVPRDDRGIADALAVGGPDVVLARDLEHRRRVYRAMTAMGKPASAIVRQDPRFGPFQPPVGNQSSVTLKEQDEQRRQHEAGRRDADDRDAGG